MLGQISLCATAEVPCYEDKCLKTLPLLARTKLLVPAACSATGMPLARSPWGHAVPGAGALPAGAAAPGLKTGSCLKGPFQLMKTWARYPR